MSKNSKTVVAKPVAKKTATKAAKPVAKKAEAKAAPEKKAAPKAAKPAAKVAKLVAETPKAEVKPAKAPAKKVAEKSAKAAAPKKVAVEFIADCPLATTVSIAGSFNNWTVDVDMLKKDEKTGLWVAKISLVPGDYEYKFVCDGKNWDAGDNKIKHV